MNGVSLEVFESNGYVVLKAVGRDDLIFVIDPETGVVRDINTVNGYCGAYCYHNLQTDLAFNFGEAIIQMIQNYDWKKSLGLTQITGENEYLVGIIGLLTDPFIAYVYGGNVGTNSLVHVEVQRTPYTTGFWVVECALTYYIAPSESHTYTQYWVLIGGILGKFIGGSHTFEYILPPSQIVGGKIMDIVLSYKTFYDAPTRNMITLEVNIMEFTGSAMYYYLSPIYTLFFFFF
jgi:hypothetical protein